MLAKRPSSTAMAWSRPDFVLFNGTNLLPYPEGRDLNFPATVTVRTQPGWLVATGMRTAPAPGSYREGNYHDLVDKPFFVGRMDVDSVRIEDRWHRLATYPTVRQPDTVSVDLETGQVSITGDGELQLLEPGTAGPSR